MKKILIPIFCFIASTTFSQKRATQFSITGEGAVMATKQAFGVYNAGFGGSAKVLYPTGKKNYFTTTLGIMAFSGKTGKLKDILELKDADLILLTATVPEPYKTSMLNYLNNTNTSVPPLTIFPIKIGYKYFLNKKFNTELEAGYTFASVTKVFDNYPGEVGGYDFSLGFGFMINKKLDIGLRYELFESTASEQGITSFLALRTLINIDFK